MRVPFQKQRGINGSVKESGRVRISGIGPSREMYRILFPGPV